MTDTADNQRRAQRLPFIVQVEFSWSGGSFSAHSTDLSSTGLFVKTDQAVPLGNEARVEFVVFSQSGKVPVVVSGEVARVVSIAESAAKGVVPGLGVRYRSLEQGKNELFQFLGRRLEAFQEPLPELPGAEVPLPAATDEGLRAHWGDSPDLVNTGTLFDLDRRGSFFLESPAPAEPGTHVFLFFSLPLTPKAMSVKATGTVTRLAKKGDLRRGMVIRLELATLDIHLIESFFRVRNRAAPEAARKGSRKDAEFYDSLGLPQAKKIPLETLEAGESSEALGSRAIWIAGAVLLLLLVLWLVF